MSAVAKLYMQLSGAQTGLVKGESRTKNFVGQIELDDWSWSIEPEADPDNSSQKIAVPSVISISKLMDRATTPMLAALRSGDLLDVKITLAEAAENQFGLVITLEQARLIDYSFDVKSEEKGVTVDEKWKLGYRFITFDHRANQQTAGSKYKVERPAWADDGKTSKKDVEKEVRTLLSSMQPGSLNELWDKIGEDIKKGKFSKPDKPAATGTTTG